MPDTAQSKDELMQRSLEDLIEVSRRLRAKAKENDAEADRIMATVRDIERVFKEHHGGG
jgi:hypothetical protein